MNRQKENKGRSASKKETLEKQLQLLSKRSERARGRTLVQLTSAMCEVIRLVSGD